MHCHQFCAASQAYMLRVFALQALPLFLDRLADPVTAVLVSVVVVLIFGKLQLLSQS